MKRSLVFSVAVAGVLTLTGNTLGGDELLSPRAKAHTDSLRKVPGTSPADVNLATNRPIGNAKDWEAAHSFRKLPSPGPSIDLAHGPLPTLSPKDPRYAQELRRLREVQIAPLK